jgi:hypothetical protein
MNRKVLRRMFVGIKVNGIGRKGYNKELMQLFGDLDVLSFVRISRLDWIGPVNIMDSKRKVSQVFNNNVQGSRLRGRPNTNGGTVYEQILINGELKTGEKCQETELTGRSPLGRRRSALDCSAI